MHSSQLTMAAAAILISSAAASPVPGNPVVNQLMKRQSVSWENPDGGNINMFFGDAKLNYGTMKPSDIIRNNVSASCTTEGLCIIGTTDVGQSTIEGGNAEDVSYTVDGQYASWIHNGFIDLLAGVMDEQTTSSQDCYSPAATGCNPMAYCPLPTETCNTLYQAPSIIGVVITEEGVNGDTTPGAMQVEFSVQVDSDGICSTLTTVGGALAGNIPEIGGYASGLFSLAGLGCASS